jgi:peptide deformylase
MVREILQIGQEQLHQVSATLKQEEILSRETKLLVQDLLDTCNAEKESTAGISAVQIGVLKRVFVARILGAKSDSDKNPQWEVFINPEIEVLDSEDGIAWEGCLSIGIGDSRLFGPVSRPRSVRINYLDEQGTKQTRVGEGYQSHIFQHELDHLNGKLFLQYVSNPENIWTSKGLDLYISEHDSYPPVV